VISAPSAQKDTCKLLGFKLKQPGNESVKTVCGKLNFSLFSNNSKATAVTTHQANQSQFICTGNLISCSTHLQSYAKVDNETELEKLRTVAKNKSLI